MRYDTLNNAGRETFMTVEDAKDYLAKFGLENRVQEFETSSATVELAAQDMA